MARLRLVRAGDRVREETASRSTTRTGAHSLAALVLALVLFLLLVPASGADPSPPYYGPALLATPSLVGYWPLDETTGTTAHDQTTNPANGTYNSVTLGGAGAIQTTSGDLSASFNGSNSYVSTGSPSKLQPSKSASLELWFKTATASTMPIAQVGAGLGVRLSINSSGQVLGWVDGSSTETQSAYKDGNWHYAVVTWDGSKVALYVDGALAAPYSGYSNPMTEGAAPNYQSTGLTIGRDVNGNYLTGSVDEPAFYGSSVDTSGALTAGQIANHYAAANTGPISTPVNVVLPTVSGRPLVGSTYTVTSPGSWNSSTEDYGALSYSYQWLRCGYTGTSCSAISGATGSSYTIASADNTHALAVQVTASNTGASASATVNLSTIGGYRAAVFADGGANLLGYWPFDETYNYPYRQQAADISDNPAVATYQTAGESLNVSGAINDGSDRASTFNGSSGYATTAAPTKLQPSKSASLELWFKTTSTATTLPIAQVGGSLGVRLALASGQVAGFVDNGEVLSNNSYNDGNWHYAVVTWNGTVETLYIDGTLAAPSYGWSNPMTEGGAPNYQSTGLTIGRDVNGNYYTGSIDEPAFYGSSTDTIGALSAGQIANHYAAANTGPVMTPVNVVAPTLSGRPLVGSTYTVTSPGSWSSSTEIYGALGYAYQWLRCGYDGTGCSAIGGATGSTYTVATADNTHALAVQVTASNNSASASVTVNLPTIGGYRSAVFTDGGSNLVGYWPFDETYSYPSLQQAADISDSPAAVTYRNPSETVNVAGAINDGSDRAATFLGTGYATTGSPSKLQPSKSASLELWFKTTSTAATLPIAEIGSTFGVRLALSSGQVAGFVDNSEVLSKGSYNDGNWHYAVLTWNGTVEALYVDGALATPSYGWSNPTGTGVVNYQSVGLTIGRDENSNYYTGSIDELAFYGSSTDTSGVLTSGQISNHYRLAIFNRAPASWTRGGSNDAVPGLCNCTQAAADPVNTENGDFSETKTDVSVASYGPEVSFSRTYDASLAQAQAATGMPGALGYGWTDNWNMTLSVSNGAVTINQADGAQVTFYPPVSGACQAPYVGPGTTGTYCALPDVTASLTYDSGSNTYTFTTHPYQRYTFNSSGQLTAESSAGGAALSVSYNSPSPGSGHCPSAASSCTTISSASGRALVIAKNSSSLVTSVIDPIGRTWTYTYCSPPSSTCSTNDLISVTDPMSRVTSFTYDTGSSNASLKHDLLTITRPNGQTGGPNAGAKVVNVYDSAGRVTSQTDPNGNQTTFNYTNFDAPSGSGSVVVTDPDGNETQYTYDRGILVSQVAGYTGSSSFTTSFQPDPSTLLDTSIVQPNGTSTYAYNGNGSVTSSTNTLGQTASYSYNSFDEPSCAATALAAVACSSLSPPSAVTPGSTITPPASAPPAYVTFNEYDTNGSLIWTTAGDYNPGSSTASQERTTYELYSGNSVTIGSNTDSCSATPPASSLPCATIDANGVVTQLSYNSSGDVTSTSTPDGNSGGEVAKTSYGYDGDGERTSVTAPNGNLGGATAANFTTTTVYDNDGEVTSITVGQTGGGLTARANSFTYDGNGNRITVTNARSKQTTYTYTANDQLTLVADPDGQATLTCYDGDGNIAQTVPPVGVAANSLMAASCPTSYPSSYENRLASDATTNTFNALNEKTTVTTPAPAGLSGYETTSYSYDNAGRVSTITAPSTSNTSGAPNQVTTYTYDSVGELLSVTNGSGTSAASTTSYCYDPIGEKTATVSPDGNTSSVAACSSSAPYQTTSPYQTGYSYDSLGELVSRTRPVTTWATSGQTTALTYDPAGNLLTSVDPSGVTTTDTYTPLNQVATVSYSASSAHSVANTYDANGNKVSMVDGTGTSTYVYDPFDELTSYQNGAGQTVTYSYNDDGKNTGITYPLGGPSWALTQTVAYGYDNADELNSITDFNNHAIAIANTADGLPNSLTLGLTGDTIATTYDPTDTPSQIALTNSSSTLLQFAYSDVPSGGIASETDTPSWTGSPASYAYDAQSRITQMTPGSGSALTYGFDASGNLTTLPTSASGTYDNASELTSSALSGSTTTYTFDADGQRTAASQGGSTIASASYNGAQELTSYANAVATMSSAGYDGTGLRQTTTITPAGGSAATQSFTWNPSASIPQLLIDSTNAYIYGAGNAPVEQVALSTGTVQYLVSDSLGSIRGIVDSSGFVSASTAYDAWGNPETSGGLALYTPFGYAGGYVDPTGLSYLIRRYYDPQAGQFLTIDPLVQTTEAPYSYALDDPVDRSDPSGLCASVAAGSRRGIAGFITPAAGPIPGGPIPLPPIGLPPPTSGPKPLPPISIPLPVVDARPTCSVNHGQITLYVWKGKSYETTWMTADCQNTTTVHATLSLDGVTRRGVAARSIILGVTTNWLAYSASLAALAVYAEGPGGAKTYYDVWSRANWSL
jgi:RHS repeat-associated protein